MAHFQVSILAADHSLYEGPCEMLIVPTLEGQMGILAHHSDIIAAIVPGFLKYCPPDGEEQFAAVSSGMIKVENNEVLVLVDTAEKPEEIDEKRAERAATEAKELLLHKLSIREYRSAQANLAREINRLRVKDHYYNK